MEQHYKAEFGRFLKHEYSVERVSGDSQLKISFPQVVEKNDIIICTAQILENSLAKAKLGDEDGITLSRRFCIFFLKNPLLKLHCLAEIGKSSACCPPDVSFDVLLFFFFFFSCLCCQFCCFSGSAYYKVTYGVYWCQGFFSFFFTVFFFFLVFGHMSVLVISERIG